MNVALLRILFICLSAAGAFMLYRIIPVLFRMITEKPLVSMPLTQPAAPFHIAEPGSYSIWQKERTMWKTRVETAVPAVISLTTGLRLPLTRTMGMLTANDGSGTRRQIYTFMADSPGEYRLEIPGEAAGMMAPARSLVPGNADPEKFSFEIRKPMPVAKLVLCILGLLLGFGFLMAGILLARLAPGLF